VLLLIEAVLPASLSSEWFLMLGFVALCAGPLMVWLLRSHAWSTVALDSFCLITVSGFVLLHLLPESVAQAGWMVLPLALLGFVLPSIAERTLHQGHRGMRRVVIFLAVLGIAAHTTLDGLFLNLGGDAHQGHGHKITHELTAWAVILHRIPEGLGIWWIVPRTLGVLPAVVLTVASISGTLFGYFMGESVLTDGSQNALALLQSLLVGSLLHVVLHAHIPAPRDKGRFHWASVLGAGIGVAVLGYVIHDHFPKGRYGSPADVFVNLALESAPALLIAYVMVGLCHAFMPASWLKNMSRGPKLTQAFRGVAVGLPLPVCSCGVVPIYRQLISQGATIAAAIAFLVATPELELAAVMLTWQLMGGEVALVRIGMAAVLALMVGVLVASFTKQPKLDPNADADQCSMPDANPEGLALKLKSAFVFGFGRAVDSTATWIFTGLFLSALLMPYVDPEWIAGLPAGIDVPVAALIGLPLYVCATGSTPLAAMLLVQGLSPGAVLALLLTGPATNITTFGVLAKLHGKRTTLIFACSMWAGAVGLGYVANWAISTPELSSFGSDSKPSTLAWSILWIMVVVFVLSLLRQGVRPFLERLFESPVNLEDGHGHSQHGHAHDRKQSHEPGHGADASGAGSDCCGH
jgi:hypothetical protein